MTQLGNTSYIDALLTEYVSLEERGNQLLEDETNTLLYAVVRELQAQRLAENGPDDLRVFFEQQRQDQDAADSSRGVYGSVEIDATASDWSTIDLDFTTGTVDVRDFSEDIEVAFREPDGDSDRVPYSAGDDPVLGIPVATSKIWVRTQSGSTTVRVDTWRQS